MEPYNGLGQCLRCYIVVLALTITGSETMFKNHVQANDLEIQESLPLP